MDTTSLAERTTEPFSKIPLDLKSGSGLLIASLWIFASIFAVAKTEFSSNVTGLAISFNIQDVLFVTLTSWLLHKGFATKNAILIVPWVMISLYGLYYNHYKSLAKMTSILKKLRGQHTLTWIAIMIFSFGIFIRILLTLRVLQLGANLWYRKKLEREIHI